jgi:hypothetical protein
MQQHAKTNRSNFLRVTGLAAVLAAGITMSGQVNAASLCKGLDDVACGAASSCSWVNAYERKDGRKVNGFCRTSTQGVAKKTPKTSAKSEVKK